LRAALAANGAATASSAKKTTVLDAILQEKEHFAAATLRSLEIEDSGD
jgi:hypothetical protein